MGPNREVVVKNLIQKRITPLTRVSLEALVVMNEVISMAVQMSEEKEELKMAEEALKDEAEWTEEDVTVEAGEVSHVQADLEEMLTILKELDIASRKKNNEKAAVKKKLSQKQQQLQNAAKSSKKITEFFRRKKQPPVSS